MGRKQLIWTSLLAFICAVPAMIYAQTEDAQWTTSYGVGYDQGYPRGFEQGRSDQGQGLEFRFDNKSEFHRPEDIGWTKAMGDTGEFKKGFRDGFELGYRDGYTGKEPQIATAPPLPALGPEVVPEQPSTAMVTEEPAITPSELARADVQPGITPYRSGWDMGYQSGYRDGESHHSAGMEFDEDKAPGYKGYRSAYDATMGKRSEFKSGYKEGFEQGYRDGYSGVPSRLVSPPVETSEVTEVIVGEMELPRTDESLPQQQDTETESSIQDESTIAQSPEHSQTLESDLESDTGSQTIPQSLPRTASGLPLLALIGLAGVSLSFLTRALRK